MKTIEKICLVCKQAFDAPLGEHKRGYAHYCSLSCANNRERKNKTTNMTCAYCNVEFYRSESKKSKSKTGLYFCCREHKDLAQRLNNGLSALHPSHYGTGTGIDTYRDKMFSNAINLICMKCGYDEHPEILEVHHKDRNRKNNDISNLELLCPNCHMWDHFTNCDGRYKKEKRGIGIAG